MAEILNVAHGREQTRLVAQISAAHLVSHLHIMAIPVLLPLLPAVMGVGFVELGVAISIFGAVSALFQAPIGYLVDRVGARRMLMAGLALGSTSFALLAAYPTYETLVIAMALAGFANCTYHPCDYSILSRGIDATRMGRIFSFHTFAGYMGNALAPVTLVPLALAFGIHWAFAASSMAGLLALIAVSGGRAIASASLPRPVAPSRGQQIAGRIPFEAGPILTLTLFFILISLSVGAIDRFSVAVFVQGFGIDLSTANLGLTAFLFSSALGVLAGGVLADRTRRHGLVAAAAFALAAMLLAVIILLRPAGLSLVLVLGVTGFLTGTVAPSRDMLVRDAAPAGAEGRVFGIVSTGFNIGSIIGPVLYGYLLDIGEASNVLWTAFGFMIATTLIVLFQERRRLIVRRKELHFLQK